MNPIPTRQQRRFLQRKAAKNCTVLPTHLVLHKQIERKSKSGAIYLKYVPVTVPYLEYINYVLKLANKT